MPRVANARRRGNAHRSLVALVIVVFAIFCIVNIRLVEHLDKSAGRDSKIALPSSNEKNADDNDNAKAAPDDQNNVTDKRVLEYFREAGVELDDEAVRRLPTWSQIESLIGDKPVVLGLDRCDDFRNNVPPLRRMLGSSGMFNSGTNLVTRLMKENCIIPERFNKWGPDGTKEQYGIRWQCPWGKHTPVSLKYEHSAPLNDNMTKDDCLPIVTIRNPFDWMKSMCRIPYTAKWNRREAGIQGTICPHLVYASKTSDKKIFPVELNARLGEKDLTFDSLAHLWNEWYLQYWRDSGFPFLIVRFEDLIFRQHDTTKIICNCAGGVIKPKGMFKYIINSAKDGPGHGKTKDRTGMIDAWMKYGKPQEVKAGFSDADWDASLGFLSHELMEKLGYGYPPSQ